MPATRREIAALEAVIGDPAKGLPEEVFRFVSRITPLINVDLLLKDESGRTLLAWRDDEFYGPAWHVPGSIIRYKEMARDRVRACGRDELGAEVEPDEAPIFVLESIDEQATRGHHISLLFRCRLLSPLDEARRAGDPPRHGQWRWHERPPVDLLEAHRAYARFF